MVRVTVELIPHGDETKKRVLGKLDITNVGTSEDETLGRYCGVLSAEYTGPYGRRGIVKEFKRKNQSVWSLVGAFLKLWGHTSHSPSLMEKIR